MIIRGRGPTGTAGVIMGVNTSGGSSRSVISAPYVPEELVSQAQVVLQGKSRNLIIRELQVSARLITLTAGVLPVNFSLLTDCMNRFAEDQS